MNPYKVLGISEDAEYKEIKIAYRKLAKVHHPDVNNGESTVFKEIHIAYKTLSNKDSREEYDRYGTIRDTVTDNLRSKVTSRVMQIANKWIEEMLRGNDVDLVEHVNNQLDIGLQQLSNANSELDRKIGKLNRIDKQLIYNGKKNSLIHMAIADKIKQAKAGKKQNIEEMEVIDGVRELINEYSIVIRRSTTFTYTTSGTSSNPFFQFSSGS